MRFQAAGVFEVTRKKNRLIDVTTSAKRNFWRDVDAEAPGVRQAAGCYLFVLFNSSKAMPWYVGKAERQSFEKEIFTAHKVNQYNEVLASHKGTPYIFLIPRMNGKSHACRPTKVRNDAIGMLETLLIGMALRRNPQLRNIRDTALLRKLCIEGVLNSKASGRLKSAAYHLKKLFE